MTDIEKKALALVNEVRAERSGYPQQHLCRKDTYVYEALCRAIEQHEAFRQEVSDAVKADIEKQIAYRVAPMFRTNSVRFIIAKPVDPLAECLLELDLSGNDEQARHDAEWLVKAIAMRDGKIVWGEGR